MTAVNIFFILALIATTSGTRVRRDLGGVCQDIWNAAPNNMVVGTDLRVDTSAKAVQLFTLSGSGQTKLKDQEYVRFKALLDNYVLDPTKKDPTDAQKLKEEDNFINAIAVKGGPVDVAYKYLLAKKKTTAMDLNAFKTVLSKMWFAKYAKGKSQPTYSGFEHTFVVIQFIGISNRNLSTKPSGELDSKKQVAKGLHNWYQFYLEQAAKRLTYTPPPKNVLNANKKPPIINVAFNWNRARKPRGSSFCVGTSPAFEIALYTACFFGEPGDCTCSIGGQRLMIKTIDFNKAGMVLTSYPVA